MADRRSKNPIGFSRGSVKLALFLASLSLRAQDTVDIRITAQTLSRQSSSAMFGKLPKNIHTAAVQVCSQSAIPITVPQSRIVQQIKLSQGLTILPPAAAVAVVSAKQGSGVWQAFARYGTAGLSVVSDLTALRVINPGLAAGAMIVSAATVLGVGIRDIAPATATHQFLVLATSMMPDQIQLQPLGCTQTFYSLVESDPTARTFDFDMTVPQPAAR